MELVLVKLACRQYFVTVGALLLCHSGWFVGGVLRRLVGVARLAAGAVPIFAMPVH